MDTFFSILKKAVVGVVFLIFGFAATYIPQDYAKIHTVEASSIIGATEITQVANNGLLATNVVQNTASAVSNSATAFATGSQWVKENLLDGIGWAIAKRIVSSMVQSLINWINSGFQGSPAFVQDLQGFLLQAADEAIGTYLDDLGGIGSFVCSPFRLDVQIAVAIQYQESRGGQPAPTCTLSGIIDNIEGFISGAFSEGGWDSWFTITANPEVYTPYGSMLAAQAGARAAIINAQGEELTLLNYGDGFLSTEICELVEGPDAPREECFISMPGKIIEQALSFNLDSGRQSLIAADEIDEIISALLGQLANTAIQGVNGLLGLSSGTGYTYDGYEGGSYLSALEAESEALIDVASSRELMVEALSIQEEYRALAQSYLAPLNQYSLGLVGNVVDENAFERQQAAASALTDALEIIDTTTVYMDDIEGAIIALDVSTSTAAQVNIITEFTSERYYTRQDIETSRAEWNTILRPDTSS